MSALRSYRLLFVWLFLRMRRTLGMIVVIQVALALGIVYGLGFLLPNVDPRSALFFSTGAATITLLLMGLTVVPQEISQARITGHAAYVSTLPVPRLAPPAAGLTFWLMAQLPGVVLALVVASLRFDFGLRVNPAVVPAFVLVALTGAAVGNAIAVSLKPHVVQHVTSFVSIALLLFSPINFPADRLPDGLRAIHAVLPVQYMADLIRWSVTGRDVESVGLAFGVVVAWCAVGVALSWRAAVRRH